MADNYYYGTAYTGTKNYTQQNVQTANATGFGAAADDYSERGIDLNEQLIRNKPATFFFRMNGDAMENAHILAGDILIVDRSLKPANGKIVVAAVNGELTIRYYQHQFNKLLLVAANKRYKDVEVTDFSEYSFWGVVTYIIHKIG